MLCARYLELPKTHGRIYQALERAFVALESGYRRMLGLGLTHRWTVVFVAVLIVGSSAFFFTKVGKTFVPEEDESRFMVLVQTPLGSNLDYTSGRLTEVEAVLAKRKDV
jgi:HAE1 family hydrophobic/amphiphilic exporter-1